MEKRERRYCVNEAKLFSKERHHSFVSFVLYSFIATRVSVCLYVLYLCISLRALSNSMSSRWRRGLPVSTVQLKV